MSDYWEDILNSSSAVPRMRGVTKQRGKKAAFQSSSPVFCTTKYRGRCPKDGGVKKQYSDVVVKFLYSSPAVSRSITGSRKKQHGKKAAFQSSSPVFCTAKYRGGGRRTEGLKNNIATLL